MTTSPPGAESTSQTSATDHAELGRFSPFVAEKLGSYVYLLTDPRDGQVFYVGKGRGNRVFAHADAAVGDSQVNAKLDRIRAIRREGRKVRYELLRFGLTDAAAFAVEAAAIQLLQAAGVVLDNIVAGQHASLWGRMSTDVAISILDAPRAPEITEPTLLIKIPALWYPGMDEAELLEATHGWWVLGNRRESAGYAFTISKGVIRAAWLIQPRSWRLQINGDRGWAPDSRPRWGFVGTPAAHLAHFLNHSVKHLYEPGARAAVRYINC